MAISQYEILVRRDLVRGVQRRQEVLRRILGRFPRLGRSFWNY